MNRLKKKISAFWGERLRFQLRAAWDIFWEARRAFSQDGCMNLSAALAFYSILSLIPFLFLLVSAASYLLGSSEQAHQLTWSFLDRLFPQASAVIYREVKAISQRAGVLGWVGFLSMIWTASVIFSSLEFAMGVVFRVERRRPFLKSKMLALTMIPASALIFFLTLFVTAFAGVMDRFEIKYFGLNLTHSDLFEFLVGFLFPYLVLTIAFTSVYKIIPNTSIAFRHALAGGMSCAFLFEVAKHFFTWYIGRSSQYNVIYGSLEAIVILVMWAFYSSSILLFCAEVVSAYRRRDITLLGKAFL
ncbi:MAG: YihY/virulence factor BrkB family protein [Thermodesulfobacteriota bacterium]|nr:YihY/virulence factor BrkB family protein [Thermodesulfobacteriota bacterium]